MFLLLVLSALAQGAPCVGGDRIAATWRDTLDLTRLARAVGAACGSGDLAAVYVRGLADAQEAYAVGGSPESLRPVHAAIGQLAAHAARASAPDGSAAIAGLVLQAAAAAAQSEREELSLFIDQAVRLETVALSRGGTGAPVISAYEAAGQLWLRVHRFADAAAAYDAAVEQMGAMPRIMLGRARVAVRLGDAGTACAMYRWLVERSPRESTAGTEMEEARAYLRRAECRRVGTGSR
jgi:hypothetical protein